jgi:RNA polymerase sigma-70 factor (ECF subfamily)
MSFSLAIALPGAALASIDWPGAGLRSTQAGAPAEASPSERTTPVNVTEPLSDLACVQRVGRGDQRAFRELVDRYLQSITRFGLRTLHDHGEAEEVAQETFLRLWTEAADFEPRAQLKTWLYRVARNQCIDRIRKRRSHGTEVELDERETGEDRPSSLLLRKQTAAQVEEALATLPERQREAIALVHYEGLSGAEACEVLSVSAEALESLLARGRRALREQLRDVAKKL